MADEGAAKAAEMLQLSWIPIYRGWLRADVDPLASYARQLSTEDRGVQLSNHGGWQSDDLLAAFRGEPQLSAVLAELEALTRAFVEAYKRHGLEEGSDVDPFEIELCNLWANLNPPGGFNATHNHPGAHISGVFYAQAPPGCGQLLLRPPYSFFDVVLDRGVQPAVEPEAGLVVLFPSDVDHATEPNQGAGERISFSFNARYRPVTPGGHTFL